MSRSYRKPYSAITGNRSAKDDKVHAHRGQRRKQDAALRDHLKSGREWDEFVMPVRLECSWNNTYSWSRDGKQRLYFLSDFTKLWVRWDGVIEPLWEDGEKRFARLKRK